MTDDIQTVQMDYADAMEMLYRQQQTINRLREALKPFAALWDDEETYRVGGWYSLTVKMEDIRAARAALISDKLDTVNALHGETLEKLDDNT